jgi:sarcosine oxidase
MEDRFDAIVIGAGVMGSAAAYHLAKAGQRTLLERFEIGHTQGSSHGESHIFRFAYHNPHYARLAIQCLPLWRALEAESGQRLLEVIGGLDIAHDPAHYANLDAVADTLTQVGARFEVLDARALATRYPQWRLGDAARAVFSPDSGFLRATRCVQVIVAQAVQHGAVVHEREPVTEIIPDQPVEVVTEQGRYRSDKLIITGGAWINTLLAFVGLCLLVKVSQEQVTYFRPLGDPAQFRADRFPIFIHWRSPTPAYGFPIIDQPGVKVGFHHEGYVIEDLSAPRQPRSETVQRAREYLQAYLPDAAGEPFDPTACLYTTTPDEDFVIDFAPGINNVVICSACSGHGFKFGIGIGRALADLALEGATEMHIDHVQLRALH